MDIHSNSPKRKPLFSKRLWWLLFALNLFFGFVTNSLFNAMFALAILFYLIVWPPIGAILDYELDKHYGDDQNE